MAAYLATVFLSSFLLFQVQPLIGRYILPWFGGSPAVWTTCMLFFQVMLLAGYAYAHGLSMLSARKQTFVHLALLVAALAFLPIAPSPGIWRTASADSPVGNILMLLAANIGLPYLVLSSTAPLVQHWFVGSFPGRSPYRLYALSNAASLLALVSYPFLVEPNLALGRQVAFWSWGFLVFALCCGFCALRPMLKAPIEPAAPRPAAQQSGERIPAQTILLWLMLSACGSAALLAATNQLCQEVAVVPFLWVAPLTIYLATFIICFNSDRGYRRTFYGWLFAVAAIPAGWLLQAKSSAPLPIQLLVFLVLLFACCMACHGELARSRPRADKLTAYYLAMSTGGALGGMLVALVAPVLFRGYWELPIVMTLTVLVLGFAYYRDGILKLSQPLLLAGVLVEFLAMWMFTVHYITDTGSGTVARSRNFYGVLRVVSSQDQHGPLLYLLNGRVMHGFQYTDPGSRALPTSYYSPDSGVGLALRYHPRRSAALPGDRALRVGVIGLGTGTLATYGRPGDTFRFYEINNDVIRLADRYFSYRRDSAARIETVPGDARIVLESELSRQMPQRFDLLVVDAFTSDSIPVHLLTRECLAVYREHLKPDGLLLVHVTNHFLDLIPVVRAHAKQMGWHAATIRSTKLQDGGAESTWMVLAANGDFLGRREIQGRLVPDSGTKAVSRQWTDDFASLWQILKW